MERLPLITSLVRSLAPRPFLKMEALPVWFGQMLGTPPWCGASVSSGLPLVWSGLVVSPTSRWYVEICWPRQIFSADWQSKNVVSQLLSYLSYTKGIPIALLFVFLVRASTLDGSEAGIKEYIGRWDMSVLTEQGDVWSTAVSQIFCSIGVVSSWPTVARRSMFSFVVFVSQASLSLIRLRLLVS